MSMPTPASRRSDENEQPSCAASTAASSCARVDAGHARADLERGVDDQVPAALDLVHRDPAVDVEPPRRRARAGQLAGERHREAAAVRRGEELLGARLPLGRARSASGASTPSASNAPDVAAVIAPVPRARFPSQDTSASRTIRGMLRPSPRPCGRRACSAGDSLASRRRTSSIARIETSTWSSDGSRVVSRCSQSPGASSVISTRLSWCLPAYRISS